MITDDIFMSIQFIDCEGHCYGKIEQSEFSEEYVFFPTETKEIPNKMTEKIIQIIKLLNDKKNVKREKE